MNGDHTERLSQESECRKDSERDILEAASEVARRVLEEIEALAGTTACKSVQLVRLRKWADLQRTETAKSVPCLFNPISTMPALPQSRKSTTSFSVWASIQKTMVHTTPMVSMTYLMPWMETCWLVVTDICTLSTPLSTLPIPVAMTLIAVSRPDSLVGSCDCLKVIRRSV